jgi:ribosomal protein S18 acetylase RimI-like enzyme
MDSSIIIRPLSEDDFSAIIDLIDIQFGKDYMRESDLESYLLDKNKVGLVAIQENKVVGFTFLQRYSHVDIMGLALTDLNWFENQMETFESIGVIKMIAVDSYAGQKGIGFALTKSSIEELSKNNTKLLSICWQHKDDSPFMRILEKNNLNAAHTISNFWSDDSLEKGYDCANCGHPPCECTAVIYTS